MDLRRDVLGEKDSLEDSMRGQPGYQAIHLSAENTISGLFRDSL